MNFRHAVVRSSIGAAFLCMAVAGCASGTEQAGPSQATSSASSTQSATPTTGGSADPTAPTASLPPAADGADLKACEDGRCEVLVDRPTTVSIGAGLDVEGVIVEAFEQDTVKLAIVASQVYSLKTDGEDPSRIRSGIGLTPTVTGPAGTSITANRLRIEVVAVADGAAVLRMTPA
jgi:hypothetical protein